jgi:hypothetical protein
MLTRRIAAAAASDSRARRVITAISASSNDARVVFSATAAGKYHHQPVKPPRPKR